MYPLPGPALLPAGNYTDQFEQRSRVKEQRCLTAPALVEQPFIGSRVKGHNCNCSTAFDTLFFLDGAGGFFASPVLMQCLSISFMDLPSLSLSLRWYKR
jgi:hypothetical protein